MAARSSRAMSLRRRPTSSAGPSRGPRAPASDLRRALCSTRPTDPATSRPSGPINGARPMHSRRPPPCREWCALAPSAASPCKLSPSLCSSGTLTRRQKQCSACAKLQGMYRKRRVDKTAYAHSAERGLHVATYMEYRASQVMGSSRALVGQHVLTAESSADADVSRIRAAAVAEAAATAQHTIDLRMVAEPVRVWSSLALPLP